MIIYVLGRLFTDVQVSADPDSILGSVTCRMFVMKTFTVTCLDMWSLDLESSCIYIQTCMVSRDVTTHILPPFNGQQLSDICTCHGTLGVRECLHTSIKDFSNTVTPGEDNLVARQKSRPVALAVLKHTHTSCVLCLSATPCLLVRIVTSIKLYTSVTQNVHSSTKLHLCFTTTIMACPSQHRS